MFRKTIERQLLLQGKRHIMSGLDIIYLVPGSFRKLSCSFVEAWQIFVIPKGEASL